MASPRLRHFLLRHPEFSALFCQTLRGKAAVPRGAFSQCHLVSAPAAPDSYFKASGLIYCRRLFEGQQAARAGY